MPEVRERTDVGASVAKFYDGKSIFITGAAGFVGVTISTWMRSRRISKRILASLEGVVMVWVESYPSPMTMCTSFGRIEAVGGNGYLGFDLSIRAVVAIVLQGNWTPRQDGGVRL
ncbi:hypothetical protein AVEN_133410-1 [Araneus ventricosus]|uniref:Uncharacterized protein n=1 Tax=Araneus ventricosus TaxID=182803 RepID=A0A4Y2SG18_ARAVE|nr:hypothetical protein AVEN_133410-1 [Araneus ventricosus]